MKMMPSSYCAFAERMKGKKKVKRPSGHSYIVKLHSCQQKKNKEEKLSVHIYFSFFCYYTRLLFCSLTFAHAATKRERRAAQHRRRKKSAKSSINPLVFSMCNYLFIRRGIQLLILWLFHIYSYASVYNTQARTVILFLLKVYDNINIM